MRRENESEGKKNRGRKKERRGGGGRRKSETHRDKLAETVTATDIKGKGQGRTAYWIFTLHKPFW